jgi:hypothetical protein
MTKTKWHWNYVIRRYFYGPCLKLASRAFFLISPLIPPHLYRLTRPIFILGCSRSGTSILIDTYRKHADLCDWSEAAQIMDLDLYNPEIDHFKEASDVTAFERFRLQALFGFKTRLMRKKQFINKHPENSLRISFIKEIFPDALFIHMIREGMATVESNYSRSQIDKFRSYAYLGYFPKPPRWRSYLHLSQLQQFAYQWLDIVKYIRQVAKESLNQNNYLEIRYEDFCSRPYELFRQMDEFCGLDPKRRIWQAIPSKFPDHNYKWRQKLSTAQIEEVEAIIGHLNRELGYGVSNAG